MHSFFGPSILLTLSVATSTVSGAALHNVHRHRSLTCYEDNTLRALERFSSDAAAFCPKYLATPGQPVPQVISYIPATKLSSACACFEKTAAPAKPVSTPATTPASVPATVPTTTRTSSVKTSPVSSPAPIVPTRSSSSAAPLAPTSTSSTASIAPSSTSTTPSSSGLPSGTTRGKAYSGGKRGLVYDYHSQDFSRFYKDSSKIAFGSDWNVNRSPAPGVTLDEGAFVPTIRVDGSLKNDGWAAAVKTLLTTGTSMLFASNEPDNAGQANLSPADAATVFKNFLKPFEGQAALASPAVTNGGGATGLGFLETFVQNCQDCHFDIINVHHYVNRKDLTVDQAVSAVQSYLTKDVPNFMAKHPVQFSGAKICLGEFWLWGASDDDGADYLSKLLPWLDGNANVACYQAFGGLWVGNFINTAGTGLSKSGQVYHDL
ncbi:MAG: hypothetical protein Q9218_002468 [Villophora microphyllina]